MKLTQTRRTDRHAARHRPGVYDPAPVAVTDPYVRLFGGSMAAKTEDAARTGAHPLFDLAHNRRLLEREREITRAFDAIAPALREVAALPYQEGFAESARCLVRERLGLELPAKFLESRWIAPLDMRGIYAWCVYRTFRKLADRDFDRGLSGQYEGRPADEVIRNWGFHAIDISPCADGRLSGVADYILRLPPAVVTSRKSFAGSMFDIEESVRNWEAVELRRCREGRPNAASEPTRYLKIGVYHTSSSDPEREGCAAHGSDVARASAALLGRLNGFEAAIENSHCCGASVATLLVGVDTDTDAIKVHVPDAHGEISLERYIDNRALFAATRELTREQAKEAIRAAVARAAGVPPEDAATEGMRWFCAYLLKNNMAQIEYVRAYHEGRYGNLGHSERFVTVGESFDEVQMRNLAYQAQMDTIEEGASDMDVGIGILRKVNATHELPILVFVHFRYDGRVPGSRERAVERCRRLERAIHARYRELARDGWLYTRAAVKDIARGGRLEDLEAPAAAASDGRASACSRAETRA
jgi:carboxysome shell carbonic anhydrase